MGLIKILDAVFVRRKDQIEVGMTGLGPILCQSMTSLPFWQSMPTNSLSERDRGEQSRDVPSKTGSSRGVRDLTKLP